MKKNMLFTIVLSIGLLLPGTGLHGESSYSEKFLGWVNQTFSGGSIEALYKNIPTINLSERISEWFNSLSEKPSYVLYALGAALASTLGFAGYAWSKKKAAPTD